MNRLYHVSPSLRIACIMYRLYHVSPILSIACIMYRLYHVSPASCIIYIMNRLYYVSPVSCIACIMYDLYHVSFLLCVARVIYRCIMYNVRPVFSTYCTTAEVTSNLPSNILFAKSASPFQHFPVTVNILTCGVSVMFC